MPIVYPLTLPASPDIATISVTAANTISTSISPTTFQEQFFAHPGERWEFDVTYPPMERADAEILNAFRMKLKGRFGTFLMGDPAGATPQGVATGTPLVMGGSQTGNELVTDGWTTTTTDIMKAGDYFQIGTGLNTQLYKVLDDADSDGAGETTLLIWPSLRTSPANDAPLTVNNAKGLFRLTLNVISWNISTALHYGISFVAVEDVTNV